MRSETRIGSLLLTTLVVSLSLAPGVVTADDCTWNGGSGSWHTGGNWSCGHEPGASDTATMSTGTVTVTTDVTVQGLTLTYGTIDGPGNITITDAMAWSGGTQDGAGTTTVDTGATLELSGSTKNLNRNMINNGTATWSAGTVTQPFGVTFTNGASASLTATGSNGWGTNGASSVFDNLGTFNKSAGSTTTMYSGFNNDGTTSVTAGTFRMRGGGSSEGEFTGSGGTVDFYAGAFTLEAASSVTADDVIFQGNTTKDIDGSYTADTTTITAGTVNFNGSSVTLPNLNLTYGTLQGGADLTVSGSMTWSGGTQDGAGTTTIGASATLELSGSTRTLNRDMTNNGTALWSGGNVTQPFGVTFTNAASASLTATGSNSWGTNGAGSVFDNLGTFNKAAGSTTTMYSVFNNDGTTSVTAGTFRMRGGGIATGEFTGSGGTVRFGLGTHTLDASSSLTADDVLFDENSAKDVNGSYSANTTTVNGGTVNFNGSTVTLPNLDLTNGILAGSADLTITQSMIWSYGTQDGAGTTTIGPSATLELSGSTKTLNRDMVNNGTATWSSGTVSQPFGVAFTNGASASLTATGSNIWGTSGAGSVFNNLGDFNKGAGNTTTMYSTFNNYGTTSVTAGTFKMNGGGAGGGEFTGPGGTVIFNTGTYTLSGSSSVTVDDVVFQGNTTKNINGSYSAGNTAISAGVVNMKSSGGGEPGSFTLTGGTLEPPPRLEIHGDFTRTYGTYTHTGNTLAFVGGTTQNLSLLSDTSFNNLEVGPGTLLVEVEVNDRVIVEGSLVNYGTIRKSKPIFGGVVTFGLTAVEMNVTKAGTLTGIQVDRVDCQHPDAYGEALTDRHWILTPTGTGYKLDLTVPHGVSPDNYVYLCRRLATSSPWDCGRSSWTANSITRLGVDRLRVWAPGDSRMAPYLFADGFEYCAKWIWVDDWGLKSTDGDACGGWFRLDMPDARAAGSTRSLEAATPASGRITGSVLDRASGDPIAGVNVLFALDGMLAGLAETDGDGRYVSPELAEGTYSVMTHGADNYLHEQWSGVQCWAAPDPTLGNPVEISRGMIKEGVDFTLERGARVSGDVIDADTGQAVEGAMVRILSEQGNVVAEAVSDGNGHYRTLPLPAGVFTAVGSVRADGLTATSSPTVVTMGCGIARADLVVP